MKWKGPACENDKVAFRNYFDARNGMDIFGKRIPDMVLDSVGLPGTKSYHELSDWGMDILKVGNSLGAGSIAFMINDTIYPVRNALDAKYKLLADGPLYSSFELTFNNYEINGRQYNIKNIISILPNQYCYISDVIVEGLKGDEKFVTGIVNMHSDSLYSAISGDYIGYYTYDKQTENGDNLGMGILFPKDEFISLLDDNVNTKDVDNTYFIALNFKDDNSVKYRFYSGWELNDESFKSQKGFENMLLNDETKLSTPLKVEFNKK
ncbi:MAG: DUF4861 family protein [Saprospiraceae bacterium]